MRFRTLPFLVSGVLLLPLCLPAQTPSSQTPSSQTPPAQTPPAQTPQPAATQAPTPAVSASTAEQGETPTTLSVKARLVVVPAVVHDKRGAIVASLTRDNFVLTVDGKPQTLRYFDTDKDLPLTVGLLIDTSRSQTDVLDDERKGSAAFVEKFLAPAAGTRAADKAFVIEFAHNADLLQDVTDAHPKLEQALKDVDQSGDRPSFGNSGGTGSSDDSQGGNGGDRRSRDQTGGTVLYDAVYLASDEIESKQTNRRALVLLTDGDDRNSKESLARSIEAAQRSDTVIYAIYYKGQEHGGGFGAPGSGGGGRHGGYGGGGGGYPGGGSGGGYPGGGGNRGGGNRGGGEHVDGKKILERMCAETGGRMFEVSKKNTLDVIYAQIGDELRQGYRLGFSPSREGAEEGYHRIDLELTGPPSKEKLNVQTRDGYYTAGN